MTDYLNITFDKANNGDETGLCVMRKTRSGKIQVMKMELGEQAELLYKALTDQSFKIAELKGE